MRVKHEKQNAFDDDQWKPCGSQQAPAELISQVVGWEQNRSGPQSLTRYRSRTACRTELKAACTIGAITEPGRIEARTFNQGWGVDRRDT